MIPWLGDSHTFPEHHTASPDGLLAVGGDLNPERILAAYRLGIFPWFNEEQPPLWWSPDPRMVLIPQHFAPKKSLRKTLKHTHYEIRYNSAFSQVIHHCANTPRRGRLGTWLTDEMKHAYGQLFQMGYAHSVETWEGETLIGGLYGIRMGKVFFGESMFSHRTDASKIAFANLIQKLQENDIQLLDCQVYSDHLASLGASEIPRDTFLTLLKQWIP